MNNIQKLGIICGSGELPERVIKATKNQKIPFIICALKGFAKRSLLSNNDYFWASIGEIGTIAKKFKNFNVTHVCMVGAVNRPPLFNLKLDYLGKELLVKYFKSVSGDNSLLSLLVKTYEEEFNFVVVGPQVIDKTLLSCNDFNTFIKPTPEQLNNIKLGYKIAKQIGKLDIGQSIIVQQHMIIAVEAVEGTHKLILRSKSLLKKFGSKGILIKVSKPNQEQRIDLPTIGIKTIKAIKKSGLGGIVVENNATLILNKQEILNYANNKGLLIATVDDTILNN